MDSRLRGNDECGEALRRTLWNLKPTRCLIGFMTGPAGTNWTDIEIDLIVTDYFDMLRLELSGHPYVKARRNEALQKLIGRSRGSIEYKHQNVSAVLAKLCRDWIPGYKPMANYQNALVAGIDRYIAQHDEAGVPRISEPEIGFAEQQLVMFEAPPEFRPSDDNETSALKRLIRKYDPAARDARNRALGKRGEELIYHGEQIRLRQSGRDDLANRVRWVSEVEGDGAGFDILSYSATGEERLLEVKTTTTNQTTPFYISENERRLSVEKPNQFRLVRLYDFARQPRAFELLPPLDNSVVLSPVNYRASFGESSV